MVGSYVDAFGSYITAVLAAVLGLVVRAGAGARAKGIRNKQKRGATFAKFAKQGEKEQKKERKKRQKEAEELGEEAAPRKAQRTLDNTREPDETVVQPDDAEVAAEDSFDEFAANFSGSVPPRTL